MAEELAETLPNPSRAIDALTCPRIPVVGELMLDSYVWSRVDRLGADATSLVLRADSEECRPGCAAGVAWLARGLGAEVALIGAIGDDEDGRRLLVILGENGFDVFDQARITTRKERFFIGDRNRRLQQVMHVDRDSREVALGAVEARLVGEIQKRFLTPFPLRLYVAAGSHGRGLQGEQSGSSCGPKRSIQTLCK